VALHARLDRGAVRLLTRTGLDWTAKYPTIAAAVAAIPARQAYLDGELCGVRPDGTTSFSLMQNASDTGKPPPKQRMNRRSISPKWVGSPKWT
jgi:bifunctional non-homologous end joining protein LigD